MLLTVYRRNNYLSLYNDNNNEAMNDTEQTILTVPNPPLHNNPNGMLSPSKIRCNYYSTR